MASHVAFFLGGLLGGVCRTVFCIFPTLFVRLLFDWPNLLVLLAVGFLANAAVHWLVRMRPAITLTRPASAYTDPEDALAAAFQLDMQGDWDAAIALYAEVAKRSPDQEQYAQGRIKEIEDKQRRANQ